jgi:transposase
MRPHGSPQQLEQRRRQAVALKEQGLGPAEIACRLKTTPQSVCGWLRKYRQQGSDGLAGKPVPGRPSKLSERQKKGLVSCLLKGASHFGFGSDLWTCPRVAHLVAQRYGVKYHVEAIPRVLAGLGFSPSKAREPRD